MRAKLSKHHGFTLVELLVVIVIIGILASLITVAVSAALTAAKRTRIVAEINAVATAIQNYKLENGSYPPSTSVQLKLHVRNRFTRALLEDINTIPDNLTPAEILWFCARGYTSDPQRPVDFFNATAKRDGMTFDQGRLVPTRTWAHNSSTMGPLLSPRVAQQPVYVFVPQDGKNAPLVYFDCSRPYPTPIVFDAAAQPVAQGTGQARAYYTKNGTQVTFANAGKYQIVSAGLDGDYGLYATATDQKLYPDGVNYTEGDKDNLVNFTDRTLADAQP
jgi:prepilin-type N-terminal cleavage/methylation domain-containing protein